MRAKPMSRRTLLGTAGAGALAAALPAAAKRSPLPLPPPPLHPPTIPWHAPGTGSHRPATVPPPEPALHALQRLTFGARPGDLERVRALGVDGFIAEQLQPEAIDDSAAEASVAAAFSTLALGPADLLELEPAQVARELKAATVVRALASRRQLLERMVEFWSDHFSVYHGDGPVALLKTVDDREVIRRHALGRFRDLLGASAKSPAMLFYLDNYANTVAGPNENYSRELMELHTLGVGGGYTEADVREVARCFTGWTVALREALRGRFVFNPFAHDFGPKEALGLVFPARVGVEEGERVLDRLASDPATARHLATKLCRRFVADDPPAAVVDAAVLTFEATDGDLREVMRTILTAGEFAAAADAKVKRPFGVLCSALRALDAEVEPQAAGRALLAVLQRMGHLPFDWHPPNGFPDVAGAWVNTNGLLNRWNLGVALGANALPGVRVDLGELVAQAGAASSNALVDVVAERLLHRPLDPGDRATLVAYAADGQPADRLLSAAALQRKVPGLLGLVLDSPYFQWR